MVLVLFPKQIFDHITHAVFPVNLHWWWRKRLNRNNKSWTSLKNIIIIYSLCNLFGYLHESCWWLLNYCWKMFVSTLNRPKTKTKKKEKGKFTEYQKVVHFQDWILNSFQLAVPAEIQGSIFIDWTLLTYDSKWVRKFEKEAQKMWITDKLKAKFP